MRVEDGKGIGKVREKENMITIHHVNHVQQILLNIPQQCTIYHSRKRSRNTNHAYIACYLNTTKSHHDEMKSCTFYLKFSD